jgi:PTS system mannose-specific IIC component
MITTALGASQVPAGASLAEISDSAITLAASIGVALASLFIELNVLTRFANTYFQHRADKYVQEGNEKKIVQMNVLGAIPWVLASALPLSLFLIFGQGLVAAIESAIPTWLMEGFRIAGSMLPVVGFAILMRYLPVAKEPQWLLVGFILAAYYHTPIIGISLVGLVIAYLVYRHSMNKAQTAGAVEVEEDEDE